MYKILLIVCALFILTYPALAQNEIDHINTLWPSGYGKLALDSDTLYVNILNGHGVERYDLSNPANPIFIDREEVSGFDQIDFQRRLMAKLEVGQIHFASFGNWNSTRVVSSISLPGISEWKLIGDYLIAVSSDDSIRTYNISIVTNPVLVSSVSLFRNRIVGEFISIAFGSSVCGMLYSTSPPFNIYYDIYDIRSPETISLGYSDTIAVGGYGSYGLSEANGDTMAIRWQSVMFNCAISFNQFFPDRAWQNVTSYDFSEPHDFRSSKNGFVLLNIFMGGVVAFSYQDMSLFGGISINSLTGLNFELYDNEYFIYALKDSLTICQATYSGSLMPEVCSTGPAHHGILSSASYGNYILSGAESNGGELLIHELNDANRLSLISNVPTVQAKKIIVNGSSATCLCPNKISQVDLSNPLEPIILHELSALSGELVDFDMYDSLLFAITDRAYYVINYDSLNGMTILSRMDFPSGSLTSIDQNQTTSLLLEGSSSHLVKVSAANPIFPIVIQDWRIPADTYQNLDVIDTTIWVSGRNGTRIFNIEYLDSVAFYGPEYFSDVHQMFISNDTVYVADGINGIKIFRFRGNPIDSLTFIGGYGTGNVVNQISTIGNNFFASDYYSLQHLRWGAPTGIEVHDNHNQPEQFSLSQNYPNPFNAQTTITYNLPRESEVNLSIYNILGEQVDAIESGKQAAGTHSIFWNSGNLGSGLYFYKLTTAQTSITKKMLLLK